MQFFETQLARRNPSSRGRRWLFVPNDQLNVELGPLAREPRETLGVVLVESGETLRRRPHHRQKLALLLANQRSFALEAAEAGVAVCYRKTEGTIAQALLPLAEASGPLRVMEPAERELREELRPLVERGHLIVLPHEGWLSTELDFRRACLERKQWRMDAFYRRVRRRTGILMEGDDFAGGRLSFDVENRKPWRGDPPAPERPRFPVDDLKKEVAREIERDFAEHPGRLDLEHLPATRADAEAAWSWAKRESLPHFGPYEDAMSTQSRTLFHTRISELLNLHRLLPARVIEDALELELELPSLEGFVRQILGWREFVRHVHRETDGFRKLPDLPVDERGPNFLGAEEALPDAWWGTRSGLACLDDTVESVWQEGYSHHITRLMVLSNLAVLLDVEPRALSDWFHAAYTDAYDWVVEPNVLGMGAFALGDLMTTKPYVSGAAYLHRMGDHCAGCAFDPKRNCPITRLYWAFLDRHREKLGDNPRLALPYRSLSKRSDEERRKDVAVFERMRERLRAGEAVTPTVLEEVTT